MSIKPLNKSIILKIMQMFEQKNLQGLLEWCDENCVIIDPHYPYSRMEGKEAIRRGMAWAFRTLKRSAFEVHRIWIDGPESTIYVRTYHQMVGGYQLNVPQIFYVCWNGKKITRIESFLPYRPGGIPGIIVRWYALLWRCMDKTKLFFKG